MTENNLKNMIENHELDNLMTNGEELEKLKSSRTTEQVLEILKKYNYTETSEVFERELLEILQRIKLNEEEMKNVSGGKVKNTKHLAVLMGGLTMAGAMGLHAYAKVEDNRGIRKELETRVLNKVDKKSVGLTTAGLVVGGVFVEALNLLFRKPKIEYKEKELEKKLEKEKIIEKIIKDEDFSLTEENKQIYENTKKLSDMILNYVKDYIEQYKKMPNTELKIADPEHQKILELIGQIRNDWLNVYENTTREKETNERKKKLIENQKDVSEEYLLLSVTIDEYAVENLFYGLPVGETEMTGMCRPKTSTACTTNDMAFLVLLSKLEDTYRKEFEKLEKTVVGPNANDEYL